MDVRVQRSAPAYVMSCADYVLQAHRRDSAAAPGSGSGHGLDSLRLRFFFPASCGVS